MSGKLLDRVQGGFTAGRDFHERAVLPVPDLVHNTYLVSNLYGVSGQDFLAVKEEAALYSEAVSGSLDILERGLVCSR